MNRRSAAEANKSRRLRCAIYTRKSSEEASRALTKNRGFGRETVVLPNAAVGDEPAQSRSIGSRKSL